MDTGLVLNGKAISLTKININSNLTVKQHQLLKLLHKCMNKNIPLDWDIMVNFYVKNVNENQKNWYHNYTTKTWNYNVYSILKSYKKKNDSWKYTLKPKIRTWFSVNMGSMILKGSILALPIIELNK